MPEQVIAYVCSHGCRRSPTLTKAPMEKHEKTCLRNPIHRACCTCANLAKERETVYNPHHNGNPGSTDYEIKSSYCSAGIDIRKKLTRNCNLWKQKHNSPS